MADGVEQVSRVGRLDDAGLLECSPRRAESAVLAILMTVGLDLCSKKYVLPHSAARHMIAAEGWSQ